MRIGIGRGGMGKKRKRRGWDDRGKREQGRAEEEEEMRERKERKIEQKRERVQYDIIVMYNNKNSIIIYNSII